MIADVSCQCNGVVGQAYVEMLDDEPFAPQLCWNVSGKFYTNAKDTVICCVKCKSIVVARLGWK